MLELKSLWQTCEACPSQWEGELADGTPVYIRYRWGWLRVDLHPWTEKTQTVYRECLGHELDGLLNETAMLEAVAGVMKRV